MYYIMIWRVSLGNLCSGGRLGKGEKLGDGDFLRAHQQGGHDTKNEQKINRKWKWKWEHRQI
jgi:hypothetical protein